jgi:5-methylcytosine-specific restriction endonuclease McrA
VTIIRGNPCAYCGAPGPEVDHVLARARGGSDHWTNLTPACRDCNGGKWATPLLVFLLRRAHAADSATEQVSEQPAERALAAV